MYYLLTITNIILALLAFIKLLRLHKRYHITERWGIYILYSMAIVLGVAVVQIRSIFEDTGDWYPKLISIIISGSKLFLAHCLKYSSIKK